MGSSKEFPKEVLERGDIWFATRNQIAEHVRTVTHNGELKPRRDKLPYYSHTARPFHPCDSQN